MACKATSTVPLYNATNFSQLANTGRFDNSSFGDIEEDTVPKILLKESILPLALQFEKQKASAES